MARVRCVMGVGTRRRVRDEAGEADRHLVTEGL